MSWDELIRMPFPRMLYGKEVGSVYSAAGMIVLNHAKYFLEIRIRRHWLTYF